MVKNPHPNATVAGGGAGLGVVVVWLLGNVFHVEVSAETGAAVAGGVAAFALLVGRHGIKGLAGLIWHGDGA